jgi:hypothetical protein
LHVRAFIVLSLLVTTFGAPACGGKSFAGAGDSSDVAAGGGSSHGGATMGGSAGVAAGGNAQSGARCDAYVDEGAANISVRIVNETKAALYLGPQPSCGAAPFFDVRDAADNLLPYPGVCQVTCQQLLSGAGIACLPVVCPIGPVLTLQPGEDALQYWNGLYDEATSLVPECRPPSGESLCQRVVAVKPGSFTFTATAGSGLDCSAPFCMTCTPSNTGGCTTLGGVVSGPSYSAETKLVLDASYGLGGLGGGMVRPVEIVFRD